MNGINLYRHAHLVLAAIRLHEHRHNTPPTIEELCQSLSYSLEQGHQICRKLEEMGAVQGVEGGYGVRYFIRDHLVIEEIDRGDPTSTLQDELRRFQNSRKDHDQHIKNIKAQQEEKRKNLRSDLEQKLREQLKKKK